MFTQNILMHRYLPKCRTVAQPPGLADFLKGTAYLYQQSKKGPNPGAFEVLVDFTKHPVGIFLQPTPHLLKKYQEYYQRTDMEVIECFNQNRPVIRNIVSTLQNNPETAPKLMYVVCHEPYDNFDSNEFVLDADDQAFMQRTLNFHDELVEECSCYQEELGILNHDYCVIHLRMGDQQSCQPHAFAEQLQHVEACIRQHIVPRWGNKVLVISDNYYTKKYLCNKYDLKCTDFIPIHMGEAARFLKRDEAASPTDIGYTLLEFMLMSKSKTIYLHSVYGWNSGFSKLCGHIYSIPYIPMAGLTI